MSRARMAVALAVLLCVCLATPAASTGRVTITTLDAAGAPVSGTELTLKPESGGPARKAITDKKGEFRHNFVPTGRYRVELVDRQRRMKSASFVLKDANGVEIARDERSLGSAQYVDMALGSEERIALTLVLLDAADAVAAGPGDLGEMHRLFGAGDFAGVLARADAVLAKQPTLAAAHYLRGMALARLDRDAEAEQAFRAALTHRPEEPGAAGALGSLLARRPKGTSTTESAESTSARLTEALGYLDTELARTPDDIPLLEHRAVALDALARREELRQTLVRLGTLEPDNPQYVAHRVQSLLQDGRIDDARALLPSVARTFRSTAVLAYDIAVYQFNEGQVEPALATAKLGLEFDEAFAELHRLIARGLLGAGRQQEALPFLRRFLELAPDGPETEVERKLLQSIESTPARAP